MSKERIHVRPPTGKDIDVLGSVIFRAFASIADRHNFPRDFPSADHGANLARALVEHPGFFGVVAEAEGRIVGSNFLDQRDEIGGVGPITIDPEHQGNGVGRRLMQAVIERGRDMRGVRLVQDAFNTASMSLYTSLGFDAKEPLALMTGRPRDARQDPAVRPMTESDVDASDDLCRRVHGISRRNELGDAIRNLHPFVLDRGGGRIAAYCTAPPIWLLNHGVAEAEADLRALLLGAAAALDGPLAMLVPIRRAEFFRWCLEQGLRVVKPMTLMAMRDYQEPAGAFYPSVIY